VNVLICVLVNQFELGAGLARCWVWVLAALVAGCGQTSSRGPSQTTANEGGNFSSGGSAGGGGASGSAGSGGGPAITLGGDVGIDENEAGSTSGPVAVPLLDTALCENSFVRVERLPDAAPFFSGTFDGEPVDVSESADVLEPPTFLVFRFGPKHVEAVSMRLYLRGRPYDGSLSVSAVDCGRYGDLFLRTEGGLRYYKLASAEVSTITNSVDGFSGLTQGSVFATWINDDGEQHVLDANFVLNAIMGDARVQADD
jgi:hypothetical protein